MPEWSKGVDLRSTVFARVGSNPTFGNGEHGYGEHGYGEHGYGSTGSKYKKYKVFYSRKV